MTQGPSFAGGHESPCPFIQERPEGGEFLLELTERFHAPESYTLPAGYATLIYLRFLKEYPKAIAFLLYGGTDRYDEDQIHFTPITDFFRDAIHLLFCPTSVSLLCNTLFFLF